MKNLFVIFESLILISAFMVIISYNPMHSILFLILTFINATFIILLLGAEYIAILFLIVYVGAIAILFLFVVMMLHIRVKEKKIILHLNQKPVLILTSLFFFFVCYFGIYIVESEFFLDSTFNLKDTVYINWFNMVDTFTNIEVIGQVLFLYYGIPFILSSIVLFIAMIGAIVLTLDYNKFFKKQNIFHQTSRSSNFAVFRIF